MYRCDMYTHHVQGADVSQSLSDIQGKQASYILSTGVSRHKAIILSLPSDLLHQS